MEFQQYQLDFNNLFEELSTNIQYEYITKGRLGTNIIKYDDTIIPIVRTTTKYYEKTNTFQPIHENIIQQIKEKSNTELDFNHAMVEIYDSSYKTMGYHTDQAIDLDENSYIAIFSCYNTNKYDCRTLMIKNKETNTTHKLKMYNNSVLLFSVSTNSKHLHKIILETNTYPDTKWLGITFRLSKTFIHFIDTIPYFLDNTKLEIANEEQTKEFLTLKKKENQEIINTYPTLYYSINPSDFMY